MTHLEASDIWLDGEPRQVVTVLAVELDAAEALMQQMADALSYGYNHAHYNYETAKYFSDAMAAYRVWKGGV